MRETSETNPEAAGLAPGGGVAVPGLEAWFVTEVLPLEAALMHYLRQNWRNPDEIADIRQDIYVQVYDAARKQVPTHTKAFVFQTARNLLIDRVRHDRVVPIEAVPDLETLDVPGDAPSPERAKLESLIASRGSLTLRACADTR